MSFSHIVTDFVVIGIIIPISNFFNIPTDEHKVAPKIIENQVKRGFVTFQIEPDFAKLKIDGKIYENWENIELSPHKYKVEVSADDYIDYKGTIKLDSEDTLIKKISLKPNFGYLVIRTEPPDVEMKIDGKISKIENVMKLPLGKHKVEVSCEGYIPKIDLIEIFSAKNDTLWIELKKKVKARQPFGSLLFRANPPNAKIVLKREGVTIKEWQGNALTENLLAGEYELIAKSNGFSSFKKSISICENRISIEYLKLNSPKVSKQDYSVRELKGKIAYYKRKKYFMLAISLVGFAFAEGMHLLANEEYYEYKKAKSPSECTSHRSNYCLYNNIACATAVAYSVPLASFSYYRHQQKRYEKLLWEKL